MSRPLPFLALFVFVGIAAAEPPRFRFALGETLAYHLVQTTNVVETVVDQKTSKPVETTVSTKARSRAPLEGGRRGCQGRGDG